jgi:hypothetical protein
MGRDWKSRPAPRPTTITEICRRYAACAAGLARAFGLPLTEDFLRQHRESISCCFIEASRADLRLPASVQLPPLVAPVAKGNGQAGETLPQPVGEVLG